MTQKKIKLLKNLSTAMVVAAMALAFMIAGVRIFGLEVYGVLTGSMEPNYPTGSMIYVKDVDASSLRVNDVITFSISQGVIATHRIVEVVPDTNNPSIFRYRTKGDANDEADASLVSAANIIGKVVFKVPRLGYVANYIQQPPGIYVAIAVGGLMVAFVFYTDSLETKAKQSAASGQRKRRFTLVPVINKLSMKVLGKQLLKNHQPTMQGGYMQPPYSPMNTGYAPQAPYYPGQQPGAPGYQPGYYHGQPYAQYPQQGQNYPVYPQQQQPYYPQQQQQGSPVYLQQPYGQPYVQGNYPNGTYQPADPRYAPRQPQPYQPGAPVGYPRPDAAQQRHRRTK